MTLADYLKAHDLSAAEFARRVQSNRQNVSRWKLRRVRPRAAEMQRIAEATEGKVTANDFYGVAA